MYIENEVECKSYTSNLFEFKSPLKCHDDNLSISEYVKLNHSTFLEINLDHFGFCSIMCGLWQLHIMLPGRIQVSCSLN